MSSANPLQDAVTQQLRAEFAAVEDAPKKMAAVAKKHVLAAAKQGLAPKDAIAHACHAVMNSLLLIDKPLPKGAVASMHGVNEAAQEQHWDSMEAMSWAMEGIARVKPAVSANVMHEIQSAIDTAFMGAGEAFGNLLAKTG